MNTSFKIIWSMFFSFLFQTAYAHNFPSKLIPTKPVLRPEGVQQISETCHAAAFLTALEHHFQRLDKPVKLSLFHMIYSMRMMIEKSNNKEAVPYNTAYYDEASVAFIEKHGSVVPYYMHPEEHRMTSTFFTLPKQGTKYFLTPDLANVPEDYRVGWPTLRSNILVHDVNNVPMFLGQNEDPIKVLKETVVNNKAAALVFTGFSVQALFEDSSYEKAPLLERTVLNSPVENVPRREVSKNLLDKFYFETVALSASAPGSHALALVGFDDSLYQNYGYKTAGGFIVKGTWDDSSYEYASIPYQVILDLVDLNAHRVVDFVKKGQMGGGIFVLRLQVLDLPQGFDDDVFTQYERYKNDERFRVVYFPYLASLTSSREKIDTFSTMVTGWTDFSELSSEKLSEIRRMIVSLFLPWSSNVLINVAILSGVERMHSLMGNGTISFSYKDAPSFNIYPQPSMLELFDGAGGNTHFLYEKPHELTFWKGFFYMADVLQTYFDSLKAAAQKEDI